MRTTLVLAAMFLFAGCVTTVLVPAEEASTVGPGHAATEEIEGVRVYASALAWSGRPVELRRYLTPILVELDNRSGRPLLVRRELFELVGPGTVRLSALGPFQIRGTVSERVGCPECPYGYESGRYSRRFGYDYGPYYPRWYGFGAWYDWYPAWRRYRLPTADMVYMALEEGVLEPGARRIGFVYFPLADELPRVHLTTQLVDADTGETIGVVDLPFVHAQVPVG